jgi:hypothetical protein
MKIGLRDIFIAIAEDRETACRPHGKLVPMRLAAVVFLLLPCMFHQAVPSIARTNAPEAAPQMPPHPMQTMPRLAQAKRSPNSNTVGIVTGRPNGTISHSLMRSRRFSRPDRRLVREVRWHCGFCR